MTAELEQKLQKRLDEAIQKKENQQVSFAAMLLGHQGS
jgi:hypothetical protein